MSLSVELEEVGGQLAELLDEVSAGADILITRNGQPVARLVPVEDADRVPGSAKGLFTVPEDFDAPLEDFREYM